MGREWIKLHVDKWLDGSIRRELTEAQRGIWSDLLALAGRYYKEGKREGLIPLREEDICCVLRVRKRVFEAAISKLIETQRIHINEDGIEIINFRFYNPSRQQVYEDKYPEARIKQKDSIPTQPDIILHSPTLEGEGETDRDREGDRDIITSSKWYQGFRKDYPAFKDSDLEAAYEWIAESNEGHPRAKPRSVTKRFLINWAKKKEEGSGTHKRNPKAGRVPERYTPADEL